MRIRLFEGLDCRGLGRRPRSSSLGEGQMSLPPRGGEQNLKLAFADAIRGGRHTGILDHGAATLTLHHRHRVRRIVSRLSRHRVDRSSVVHRLRPADGHLSDARREPGDTISGTSTTAMLVPAEADEGHYRNANSRFAGRQKTPLPCLGVSVTTGCR